MHGRRMFRRARIIRAEYMYQAMRFDENGADYQGVAVTAEAYRENGFYYCIRSVYKELHADHETRVPLGTRLCVAKCSVLYALSALP